MYDPRPPRRPGRVRLDRRLHSGGRVGVAGLREGAPGLRDQARGDDSGERCGQPLRQRNASVGQPYGERLRVPGTAGESDHGGVDRVRVYRIESFTLWRA